jgi:hypothetical protein
MVNVCPAIVTVAMRAAALVLAATVMLTVPFPVPLAPDVILTKVAVVLAVHGQLPPVTVTLIDPPELLTA